MFYVRIENGKAVEVSSEFPTQAFMSSHPLQNGWEYRGNWKTFEMAAQRAAELNMVAGKFVYDATDSGPNVHPQFDIIRVPAAGDKVSYSFNGDSYPDGVIVSVSSAEKNFRIVKTDTGSTYYRRKQSGAWVKKGGTWSLIQGHVNERNPSF